MKNRREELPDLPKIPMNWTWIIATLAATVGIVVLMLTVYYPSIPDPMPTHWNGRGEADAWEPKTMGTFLFSVLLGPVILLATAMFAQMMVSMQSGDITGPGGAKTAAEAHRKWASLNATSKHIGWFFFVMNTAILLMMLNAYRPEPLRAGFALSMIAIFIATAVLLWCIVKSTRTVEQKHPLAEDKKRWGIFVNDPDNKSPLVDTGTGMNYTFNIAHTSGKILAVVMMGLPIVFVVWISISSLL